MSAQNKQGQRAELILELEAHTRGFSTSRPTFPASYDILIDAPKGLFRVQVKSTTNFDATQSGGAYRLDVRTRSGPKIRNPYAKNSFDILAALVVELNQWYFIPEDEIKTAEVRLYPHRDNPKGFYETFKTWEIFE